MILLDKKDYFKALEPLQSVEINHLFASVVIEGHIGGTIYVDDVDNPASFYVVHPYGMSLLFGHMPNEEFNSWLLGHALNTFNIRDRYEWLQVFPDTWNKQIATRWEQHLVKSKDSAGALKNKKIEEHTRVNFKFNKDKYLDFKSNYPLLNIKTHRTDNQMFEAIQGSVIPARFWDNVDDFSRRAVAFSVLDGDKVASTAFSAFVVGNQLEIGIETLDAYRGKGYAIYTCMALIDYCLEHDYEPIWACRLKNTASYQLAQKLGFEPTIYWPFYRLND